MNMQKKRAGYLWIDQLNANHYDVCYLEAIVDVRTDRVYDLFGYHYKTLRWEELDRPDMSCIRSLPANVTTLHKAKAYLHHKKWKNKRAMRKVEKQKLVDDDPIPYFGLVANDDLPF